jgi:hypothetical protein
VVRLDSKTTTSPPLEIWPEIVIREEVPKDVLEAFGAGRPAERPDR